MPEKPPGKVTNSSLSGYTDCKQVVFWSGLFRMADISLFPLNDSFGRSYYEAMMIAWIIILLLSIFLAITGLIDIHRKFSIISGTVGFGHFFPALSKPVVGAWPIFGVLPRA